MMHQDGRVFQAPDPTDATTIAYGIDECLKLAVYLPEKTVTNADNMKYFALVSYAIMPAMISSSQHYRQYF